MNFMFDICNDLNNIVGQLAGLSLKFVKIGGLPSLTKQNVNTNKMYGSSYVVVFEGTVCITNTN